MSNYKLIAVDNLLAYAGSADVSAEQITAYSYSMTAAQTGARDAYRQRHGAGAAIDFTSDEFVDLLAQELQLVAWQVENSGRAGISSHASGSTPIVQMTGELQKHLGWGDLFTLGRLGAALGAGGEAQAHLLLDFWLSAATSFSEHTTELAIGPLVKGDNAQPSLVIVLYSFDVRFDKWNLIFNPYNAGSFNMTSRFVLLNLDMSAYRVKQSAIESGLKDQIEQRVQVTDLDL